MEQSSHDWLPTGISTAAVTVSGFVLNEDARTGTLVSDQEIGEGSLIQLVVMDERRLFVVTDVETPDKDHPLQQWVVGVEEVRR